MSFSAGANCSSMILFFFLFNFKLEMKPPQSVRFHNWLCDRKRHCIILAELISDWGEGFQLHKKFDRYPIFFDCRGYTRVSFSSCQLQTRGGIWFLFYSRCNSYADTSTHTQADTLPHRVQTSPRSSSPPPPLQSHGHSR